MEEQETKSVSTMKKIGLGVLGVLVLLFIIGAMSGDDTANTADTQQKEIVAQEPTKPETEKTWTQVATLSGDNTKRGDVFTLSGNKARLIYTVAGDYPSLYVYIVKEGKSLEQSGGFPEVTGAEKDGETMIVKPAGNYYFEVNGNGSWTVTLEEYK